MNKKRIFGLMALMMALLAAQCPSLVAPTVLPTEPVAQPTKPPLRPTATALPVPTREPNVEIFLWHSWAPAERAVLMNLVDDYIRQHPNVILGTRYVSPDQIEEDFRQAATTGGGPTILLGPHRWLSDLVSADLIRPLDDIAPADLVRQMNPAAIDAVTYKGKLYALPESNECVALYYNKNLLGDREPPQTIVELLDMATDVASEGGYGLGWNVDFYHSFGYLGAFGARLFDDNYKCILDQGTGAIQGLNFIKTMKATKGVTMEGDVRSLFKNGKVAMVNDSIWALFDYQEALGQDQVGVVPLPAAQKPATPFMVVESIFISTRATDDEATAAMSFIAYLLAPEQGKLFVENAGRVPANTAVDTSAFPAVAAFVEQSKTAIPIPAVPEMGAVWGPAGDMITKVLEGKLTPEEAVAEAVTLINAANKK